MRNKHVLILLVCQSVAIACHVPTGKENASTKPCTLVHVKEQDANDTGYRRADYVKDKKKVCYNGSIVEGADAASFKLVDSLRYDATDNKYKYQSGRRL